MQIGNVMEVVEGNIHWSTSEFLKKQTKLNRKGTSRWKSENGNLLYEWDSLHGEIEVYSLHGMHVGVLNSDGSISKKQAVKGRKINV